MVITTTLVNCFCISDKLQLRTDVFVNLKDSSLIGHVKQDFIHHFVHMDFFIIPFSMTIQKESSIKTNVMKYVCRLDCHKRITV